MWEFDHFFPPSPTQLTFRFLPSMVFYRPFHLGVAAVAGVAVGGTAAYLWARQQRAIQPAPGTSALDHPALKHGIPLSSNFRVFTSYVAEYDPRLRNPKYVLEHFTADVLRGDGNRSNSNFKEDPSIDSRFRAQLDDFRGSGYDRGHMAPASNHKRSQEAMDDTFVLTNISPQVGQGFNRDYWARFERFVQELAGRCNDVYVVTGPLFLPQPNGKGGWSMQHPMLGGPPRMVAVPTHFYKIVLGEGNSADGTTVVGAFVMPNAPIDPKTPLAAYAVPVSALEEVSGISFFPKFFKKEKREAIDQVALQWQHIGHADIARLKLTGGSGSVHLLPPPVGAVSMSGGGSEVLVQNAKPGRPGYGMQHICEHNGCRMPAENWWESNKKSAKQLRRTKSSPALGAMPNNSQQAR